MLPVFFAAPAPYVPRTQSLKKGVPPFYFLHAFFPHHMMVDEGKRREILLRTVGPPKLLPGLLSTGLALKAAGEFRLNFAKQRRNHILF